MSGGGAAAVADRGSGTVLVLGVVAATAVLAGLLVPLAGVSIARHRATTAADAAALAAADALIGVTTGDPCERAAQVAAADGASVLRCVPDGLVVTVRVRVGGRSRPSTRTRRPARPADRGSPRRRSLDGLLANRV